MKENILKNVLKSLLSQDYPNCEIIAINDYSSDKAGEMIQNIVLIIVK